MMSYLNKTITIMVPAFNEEKNLGQAINSILSVIKKFKDYEIIIFDDYSSDKTPKIADDIAENDPKIKVIHNEKNMGLGYNYMRGAELATMEYYSFFPGDNENSAESFLDVLKEMHRADIIIPYPTNTEIRALHRRIISSSYVKILNLLFGLNLRYYNGTVVYKTSVLRKAKITTFGFSYSSEILIKLIRKGYKYVEVPITLNTRPSKSSAFKLKNIARVSSTIGRLFYETRLKG